MTTHSVANASTPVETGGGKGRLMWIPFAPLAFAALAQISAPVIPQAGAVRENAKDHLPYVWIASGDFEQGCSKFDKMCQPDEQPSHKVMIRYGFWMGQTEVTVGAYSRFAAATHRDMPPEAIVEGRPLNPGWANTKMPIVNVDWRESDAYCKWSGGRLPTEAEWEFAARGENAGSTYGSLPDISWSVANSGSAQLGPAALMKSREGDYLALLVQNGNTFHEGGLKSANSFGVYDLLGNVWEWTADWYEDSYHDSSVRVNPVGPASGQDHVMRGGSWTNAPESVRASVRGHRVPMARSSDTGFRCVAM